MARASVKEDVSGRLPELGKVIRASRKAVGLTQEQLADEALMDRAHMSQVELGKRNLSIMSLAKIASAVGKRPSELLAAAGL